MIVERLVIESGEDTLLRLTPAVASHLTEEDSEVEAPVTGPNPEKSKEGLIASLQANQGNVRAVSKEFGVARNTLYRWFKEFEIDPEAYRE